MATLLLAALMFGGQGAVADGTQAGPLGGPCDAALPPAACDGSEHGTQSCRALLVEPVCRTRAYGLGEAAPPVQAVEEHAAEAVRWLLYGEWRFTATDGVPGDGFGRAVALDDDRIVVGAPFEDDERGAVYLFEPDGNGGHTELRLTAPVRDERARFGFAVAMAGDRIVVGAPGEQEERGAVYLFEPDGNGGHVSVRLVATDTPAYSEFGASVAVDGERIAVGAPGYDLWPSRARGAAYSFTEAPDGSWVQVRVLASDGAGGDWFGFSVALDADRMVVGAPLADGLVGAVYVYDAAPGGWRETRVSVADAAPDSQLGTAVAMEGDLLVVGAREAVHLFDAEEGAWLHRTVLTAQGSGAGGFGGTVAVHDGRIASGAPYEEWRRGAVYVFEPDGDEGFTRTRITASDAQEAGQFGMQVDIQGEWVLAGSPGVDGAPAAAYLYDMSAPLFGLL